MKKIYLFIIFLFSISLPAQVSFSGSLVPQYTQGKNSTNNNRTPFWFWVQISGLTPGSIYHYFPSLDSLTASATSNGAGNPYLINVLSGNFRRSTNASLSTSTGYDSLTADINGKANVWMGVEPTANGRFTPGDTLYPKIMLNNGAGGTSVATRLLLATQPVIVLNYGATAGNATQGSAIYDSAMAVTVLPKSFAALYDNVTFTGRPLSLAVVEDDAMYLRSIAAIANFYQTQVDSIPQRWGTIIPNANTNGVRGLQYYDLFTGAVISGAQYTDPDGTWCSGAVTTSPVNSTTGIYLNSTLNCGNSITAFGNSNYFTVAPNPAEGVFYIHTKTTEEKIISLFDALGVKVYETRSSGASVAVNTEGLAKGMYWLRVSGNNGATHIEKILLR